MHQRGGRFPASLGTDSSIPRQQANDVFLVHGHILLGLHELRIEFAARC